MNWLARRLEQSEAVCGGFFLVGQDDDGLFFYPTRERDSEGDRIYRKPKTLLRSWEVDLRIWSSAIQRKMVYLHPWDGSPVV